MLLDEILNFSNIIIDFIRIHMISDIDICNNVLIYINIIHYQYDNYKNNYKNSEYIKNFFDK